MAEIVVSTYQGDNSVTSWSYVLASQNVDDLNRRASAVEIGSGVQEAVLSAAEVERAQNANREARQNAATTRVSTLKTEADAAEADAKTARDSAQTKRDEVAKLASEKQAAASTYSSPRFQPLKLAILVLVSVKMVFPSDKGVVIALASGFVRLIISEMEL